MFLITTIMPTFLQIRRIMIATSIDESQFWNENNIFKQTNKKEQIKIFSSNIPMASSHTQYTVAYKALVQTQPSTKHSLFCSSLLAVYTNESLAHISFSPKLPMNTVFTSFKV